MTLTFLYIRNNKIIEVCGTNVRKTYHGPDYAMKHQRLKSAYELLRLKGVPHVDKLALSHESQGQAVVYFTPKGISNIPENLTQLFEAIHCVLEALIVSLINTRLSFITMTSLCRRCTWSLIRFTTEISDG
jgi:hypothetical protein